MKSEPQVFLLSDTDHHREAVAHILDGQASISTDPQASDVSIVVGNLDLLEQARQRGRPQPMIMIGMEDDARSAVRALQGGADDYLVYSGHLAELLLAALKKAQQTTTAPDSRDHRTLTEALYDTTVALISTLDFDEVLDRILANVARVVPYDTGTIMLVDGPRARMVRNRRSSDPGQEIRCPRLNSLSIPRPP